MTESSLHASSRERSLTHSSSLSGQEDAKSPRASLKSRLEMAKSRLQNTANKVTNSFRKTPTDLSLFENDIVTFDSFSNLFNDRNYSLDLPVSFKGKQIILYCTSGTKIERLHEQFSTIRASLYDMIIVMEKYRDDETRFHLDLNTVGHDPIEVYRERQKFHLLGQLLFLLSSGLIDSQNYLLIDAISDLSQIITVLIERISVATTYANNESIAKPCRKVYLEMAKDLTAILQKLDQFKTNFDDLLLDKDDTNLAAECRIENFWQIATKKSYGGSERSIAALTADSPLTIDSSSFSRNTSPSTESELSSRSNSVTSEKGFKPIENRPGWKS